MRAFVLKKNGGIENLKLTRVDNPVISPDEVLIEVKAIGINPVDAAVRQNYQTLMHIMKTGDLQHGQILGWDAAGTVIKAGKNVPEWEGKDVFGMVNFPGEGRVYAELCAAPADQLAVKPNNSTFEEAAASSLAALTAWQALVTHANVKQGDRVLIHAAAGGVGHFAVQIAKSKGAFVMGTASAANREFLMKLGIDKFIDYKTEKFEDNASDVDVILDSVGGDTLERSVKTVKNGGRVISIKGTFDEYLQAEAQKKLLYIYRLMVSSNGNNMHEIARLMQDGRLKPHISAVFSFENLPKAHLEIETGRTRGKIVIRM